MNFYDFNTQEAAEQFKSRVERLGWTCSSVDYDKAYGWFVISNYPQ